MGPATLGERRGARNGLRGLGPSRLSGVVGASVDRQTMIRLLLVDDHRFSRRHAELLAQNGFDVVGEAGGVEEALALVSRRRPDVVLMEVELPDGSGIEAARGITSLGPSVRVVMHGLVRRPGRDRLVRGGRRGLPVEGGGGRRDRAGDRGSGPPGTRRSPPTVARHLVERACPRVGRPGAPARARPASARELEVLELVAGGGSTTGGSPSGST